MKRLYDRSISGNRLIVPIVIALLVSMFTHLSAMASCAGGFSNEDNRGVEAIFEYGESWENKLKIKKHEKTDEGNGTDLTFLTSNLQLKSAVVYEYNTGNWGSNQYYGICQTRIEYQVRDLRTNSIVQSGNWNLTSEYVDKGYNDNNGTRVRHMYENNIARHLLRRSPGNYNVEFWYHITGQCNSGCNDNIYYKHSTNDNFYFKYSYPGIIASNFSVGSYRYNTGVKSKTFSFNSYGSGTVTLTIENGTPFYFNSACTQKTLVKTIENDYAEVTIYFNTATSGEFSANLNLEGSDYEEFSNVDITLSATATSSPVVIEGAKPAVTGSTVTLTGFLKAYDCTANLYETGFKYWNASTGSEASALEQHSTQASAQKTNATWQETIYGLEAGTYNYKPYVKQTQTPGNTYKSSSAYTFTVNECDYPVGDTIYYTIDANANKDICNLVFNTVADAKSHLLSQSDWINSSSHATAPYKLLKHVVFQVAYNKTAYQTASGLAGAIDLTNINQWNTSKEYTPDKQFIVRALNPSSNKSEKPKLYGLDIRYSRNITVDGLYIERTTSSKGYENSAVIVGNDVSNERVAGFMTNADITVKNCYIKGTAFCVLHITDCDGLYMENNNMEAGIPSYSDDGDKCDAVHWGSSIKMMNVKNAKLMRNNFRGSHTTSLLLQGSQNILIMNNVFWNDNKIFDTSRKHISFIRLLSMAETTNGSNNNKLTDIGIYYNTLYLKKNPDEDTSGYSTYKCDFFRLGGACGSSGSCTVKTCSDSQQDHQPYYIPKESSVAKIEFKYNNCYSLSSVVTGTGAFGADPFLSKSESDFIGITDNNFWSKYDSPSATKSVFAIGTNHSFINVSGLMCKTVPDDPDGLVIKGNALNNGVQVTTTTGTALGANKIRTDRNGLQNARPTSGTGWTYGAYQQSVSTGEIDVIYWNGKEGSNWDTRGSWYKKVNGEFKVLTCVDVLASDLKAVINDGNTPYPEISEWEDYPELTHGEEVRTGISRSDASGYVGSKYADEIEIGYGGAITGVENLKPSSTRYYSTASVKFEVSPRTWTLVGAVIAHKSGESQATITSYDFYKQHLPEVYMQHVVVDGENNIKWGIPFTDTDTPVPPTSCFAIYVADEYTDSKYYKFPASAFYRMPEHTDLYKAENARNANVQYENSGFFINESALPQLSIKGSDDATTGGWNFFNNSYPANLRVSSLVSGLGANHTVHVYDTDDGWISGGSIPSNAIIRPQNGFIIQRTTTGNTTLNMATSWYDNSSSTKYKSADANSVFVLRVVNTLANKGARMSVTLDGTNTDAVIGVNEDNPVIYVPSDGNKYNSFVTGAESALVPLTILNQSKGQFHLQFMQFDNRGFDSVVLEDRLTGLSYDLTDGEQPIIYGIPVGLTEGRFYLNINNYSESGGDDPVITEVQEESADSATVNIYCRRNVLTVSSPDKESIESIMISDMAGRTFNVTPTGSNYSVHMLPLASGVYTVTVVTEKTTTQQKILIKQ